MPCALWYSSWMSLGSAAYAVYVGKPDFAPVPSVILCTSLMYWYRPVPGWRRKLDMTCVFAMLAYQLARAYDAQYGAAFYGIVFTGMCSYPLSKYFQRNDREDLAVLCHMLVHLLGNVSNVVLYSGDIEPLSLPWFTLPESSRPPAR